MEANVCGSSEVELSFSRRPLIMNDTPVYVRNAFKSFWQRNTENVVLNHLNLTVPKGKIYGLLGPSGCGKTTLLKCIIGRLSLDKGQVLTFGETPGTSNSTIPGPRLGYMPQEDALDGVMTIKEILYYYGCLLCVPKKRILEKITFLVNFLKLPSEKRRFSSLSGGQKRRVSFAVALIHDAELLILDEPTVGVDQILKRDIWNYLYELVEGGKKTVIITTHYIEEARSANYVRTQVIAMMFEGRFLAEGAPDHLMSLYCKNCLEDVFLTVHANQKKISDRILAGRSNEEDDTSLPLLSGDKMIVKAGASREATSLDRGTMHGTTLKHNQPSANDKNTSERNQIVRCSRLRAILYRSCVQLLRYPGLLFLMMASPTLMLFTVNLTIGKPLTCVQIGIVNEDTGYLSNKFLSHIDSLVIMQINFTSWKDARQAIVDGKMWGAVKFGQNFSTAILDRYNESPFVDHRKILNSNINVSLDGTSFVIVETVRFALLSAYEKFVSELLMKHKIRPELASIPLVIDNPIFGNISDPYILFLLPAFITVCSVFYPMGLAILVIFLDKDGGKLERLYTTGVTPFEVIFGYLIIQLSVIIVQLILIYLTVFFILQFTNDGSTLLLLALCILQGMLGTTMGVLIGTSIEKYTLASLVAFVIVITFLAASGFMWPIEVTGSVVRYICMVSPFPLPTNAMRNIMYRGWTLLNSEVSIGFALTFAWTLVLLTLSLIVIRTRKSA